MATDTGMGGFVPPGDHFVLDPGQDLVLLDSGGNERVRLSANLANIRLRNSALGNIILVQGNTGNLLVGGAGSDGDLLLFPASASSQDSGEATIHLDADSRSMRLGDPTRPGILRVHGSNQQIDIDGASGTVVASARVEVRTPNGGLRAQLAESGDASIGGAGARGRLEIRDENAQATVVFNGELGHGRLGGSGAQSRLELSNGDGLTTIVLNGQTGNLGLGSAVGREAGTLFVKDENGRDTFTLNGATGEARFGAISNSGYLALRDDSGEESVILDGAFGNIWLGQSGTPGDLFLRNAFGNNSIHLSGNTGNLNLRGDVRFTQNVADCAEELTVEDADVAPLPGSVLVIGRAGKLRLADSAYDTRVAGVVSGAGGLRPGIILGEDTSAAPATRCRLAVVGRVFVLCDASHGPIDCGDLLTSSSTPGHAMKVADRTRAVGSIIGKSLGTLREGRGLVEMLVNLQ